MAVKRCQASFQLHGHVDDIETAAPCARFNRTITMDPRDNVN